MIIPFFYPLRFFEHIKMFGREKGLQILHLGTCRNLSFAGQPCPHPHLKTSPGQWPWGGHEAAPWQGWDERSSRGQLMLTTGYRWLPALGTVLVVAWHMSFEHPCSLHYSSELWTGSNIKSDASKSGKVCNYLLRPLHYHTAMIQVIMTTNCDLLCSSFPSLLPLPSPAMNM